MTATSTTGEELEQIPRLATHGGVAVYHASETDTSDPDGSIAQVHAYGGWLDYGAFFILATTLRDPDAADDAHVTLALSIGDTGTLPGSGSATWTGAMVGVDYGRAYLAVTADAELRIPDLSAPRVDVAFTRMSDGGADMRWAAIPVNKSSFRRRRRRGQDRGHLLWSRGRRKSAASSSATRLSARSGRSVESAPELVRAVLREPAPRGGRG